MALGGLPALLKEILELGITLTMSREGDHRKLRMVVQRGPGDWWEIEQRVAAAQLEYAPDDLLEWELRRMLEQVKRATGKR